MNDPVPDGPNQGHCISRREVDILLDEYYTLRGWDANGIPKAETLIAMGLADVAETISQWACHGTT
jgi:aldehyde:ferredoxin oxidoreductase